ncbi:transglycosylase domain-containing protein [Thalassotalea euphylliae]|uniref:Glycosyl transferase family 51 domain-containing protein n=1 Tax=Thalassotalea euphylliae TaxID=1655234 RepID=A0A3E0U5E0_9GAMM|nr:transglycosylase domain-containing protein [Thalassotalea euphylliae]REL32178.1 hypothetical protein DXX94_16440 [Thalassotalea euphylliae]
MAKTSFLKLCYFIVTIPYLVISKLAYKFNWWGFRNDTKKCLDIASKYGNVKLPKELLLTLKIAEDHRNNFHFEVDQIAYIRALISNLRGSIQGASTIEQQFVRVVVDNYQRTLKRKLYEQLLAVHVASLSEKDRIGTAYLFIAYYGQASIGTLRLKNIVELPLSKLKYSDAILIIARLKYPEPSNISKQWLNKFDKRIKHIAIRLKTANLLPDSGEKQITFVCRESYNRKQNVFNSRLKSN